MGLSLIFFSLHFCLTFCVCLIFLSLSLSISFSIFSTVLLCIFTSFYILPHFTPLTLLPFESIQFLFDFRNIYSLSINFLTHFFFSFFFIAVLPKLLLFLPSLPDLLYSAVSCTAPFSPLPAKSPLCHSLCLVAGAAAVAIWDTPGGVEWGGGWWCWRGTGPHGFLPPCKQEEEDSPRAGLGTMVPLNRMGRVLFKRGNVPWKLRHLAPLHSTSAFSFICCRYECHKHG